MKIDRLVINPVNGRKDERDEEVGTGVKVVAANVIVALIKEIDGKSAYRDRSFDRFDEEAHKDAIDQLEK